MQGRRPSSKKWTSFPPEYVEQIRTVFQESFAQSLGRSHLFVEGKIFPEEICLRVGFREPSQLRQNNFEVSLDFNPSKDNAIEQIYLCIDAAAMLMTGYFEGADPDSFPREWKGFEFEKKTMYFQFSTINTDLEAEADRLLGLDSPQLVQGMDEEMIEESSTESARPRRRKKTRGSEGGEILH